MIKDITIGQYFPGDSVIHKMDPRMKIILTVVYIAALLVYNATDTPADTEQQEERHTAMCGFLYGVLRLCLSWARYSAGVMPYSARKLFKKLL